MSKAPASHETVKVTVYIVSHNYARFLREAIESVFRQSFADWELILIDDNSTDNTLDIMECYARMPRVRLLHGQGNGLAKAANLAVSAARGEYLIRLDADDVFDENILLVLSNHLDANPRSALAFPDYYLIDEYGCIFANERREQLHYKNHIQDMPPHGACTMFRKSVVEEVGGYSEELNAQDGFYIWNRIKDSHRCSNVNLPLFYYRRHGYNMTNNAQRILESRRTIKREACRDRLRENGPILAVIPCRQNFDIYPDLWRQEIGGKNLLRLAIEKCLRSDVFESIVVTCDTTDVGEVLAGFSDSRLCFVQRSVESTLPSRPLVDTLEQVLRARGLGDNGLTTLCYIQSPATTTDTLEESVFTLINNEADSSFTAEEISSPLFTRTPHGLLPINNSGFLYSDFNTVFRELKNVFSVRNACILRGSTTGARSVHFVVSDDECFFINSKRDLELARFFSREKNDAAGRQLLPFSPGVRLVSDRAGKHRQREALPTGTDAAVGRP
ncbi:glycosyltransferase family 2 protein [Nitratidesulfovibrio sp. HK-II]|uniref:glycosyltransferase family 2 protein n=1 Tax=Nitratidesulfovibrio sp. HK-II TaxID=2009266 RepID=UPI000E2EA3D3|nr:glycosyltransferase family 2 protein [Nitratidesulfovibrio sp. HK-II]GBO97682.1 glycosyl transferase [Nitratidesulfovibrio sp. HK-II]